MHCYKSIGCWEKKDIIFLKILVVFILLSATQGFRIYRRKYLNNERIVYAMTSTMFYVAFEENIETSLIFRVQCEGDLQSEQCVLPIMAIEAYTETSAPFNRTNPNEMYYIAVEHIFKVSNAGSAEIGDGGGLCDGAQCCEVMVGNSSFVVKVVTPMRTDCLNPKDYRKVKVYHQSRMLENLKESRFGFNLTDVYLSDRLDYVVAPKDECRLLLQVQYQIQRLANNYEASFCILPALMREVNLTQYHRQLSGRKFELETQFLRLTLAPYVMPEGYFRIRVNFRDSSMARNSEEQYPLVTDFFQTMHPDRGTVQIVPVLWPPTRLIDTRIAGIDGIDASGTIVPSRLLEGGFMEVNTTGLKFEWYCHEPVCSYKGPRLRYKFTSVELDFSVDLYIWLISAKLNSGMDPNLDRSLQSAYVRIEVMLRPTKDIDPIVIRCLTNCNPYRPLFERPTEFYAGFKQKEACRNASLRWNDPGQSASYAVFPPSRKPAKKIAKIIRQYKGDILLQRMEIPLGSYTINPFIDPRDPWEVHLQYTLVACRHFFCDYNLELSVNLHVRAEEAPYIYSVSYKDELFGDIYLYIGLSPVIQKIAFPLFKVTLELNIYSINFQRLAYTVTEFPYDPITIPEERPDSFINSHAFQNENFATYSMQIAIAITLRQKHMHRFFCFKTPFEFATKTLRDCAETLVPAVPPDRRARSVQENRAHRELPREKVQQVGLALVNSLMEKMVSSSNFPMGFQVILIFLHWQDPVYGGSQFTESSYTYFLHATRCISTSFDWIVPGYTAVLQRIIIQTLEALKLKDMGAHDARILHSIFRTIEHLHFGLSKLTQEVREDIVESSNSWVLASWWNEYIPGVIQDVDFYTELLDMSFRSIHSPVFSEQKNATCTQSIMVTIFVSNTPFFQDNQTNLGYAQLRTTELDAITGAFIPYNTDPFPVHVVWAKLRQRPKRRSFPIEAMMNEKDDIVQTNCPIFYVPKINNAIIQIVMTIKGKRFFYYNMWNADDQMDMLTALHHPLKNYTQRTTLWCRGNEQSDAETHNTSSKEYLREESEFSPACAFRVGLASKELPEDNARNVSILLKMMVTKYACLVGNLSNESYSTDKICKVDASEIRSKRQLNCICGQNRPFSGTIKEVSELVRVWKLPSIKQEILYNYNSFTAITSLWLLFMALLKYSHLWDGRESYLRCTCVMKNYFQWQRGNQYIVCFNTHPMSGSGTMLNMGFSLIGTHGCTKSVFVRNDSILATGSKFWCAISTPNDIGKLLGMVVVLDKDARNSPYLETAWYLNEIVVYNTIMETMQIADNNEWFVAGQARMLTLNPFTSDIRQVIRRHFSNLIRNYHSLLSLKMHIPGGMFTMVDRSKSLMALVITVMIGGIFCRGRPHTLEIGQTAHFPLWVVITTSSYVTVFATVFLDFLFSVFFRRGLKNRWPYHLPEKIYETTQESDQQQLLKKLVAKTKNVWETPKISIEMFAPNLTHSVSEDLCKEQKKRRQCLDFDASSEMNIEKNQSFHRKGNVLVNVPDVSMCFLKSGMVRVHVQDRKVRYVKPSYFKRPPPREMYRVQPLMNQEEIEKLNLMGAVRGTMVVKGLLWLYIVTGSLFIIYTASQYGTEESLEWLGVSMGGLVISVVVWEPVVILAGSVFNSMVLEQPAPLQIEAIARAEVLERSYIQRYRIENEHAASVSNDSQVKPDPRTNCLDCRYYASSMIYHLRREAAEMWRKELPHHFWMCVLVFIVSALTANIHIQARTCFQQTVFLEEHFKLKRGFETRSWMVPDIWQYLEEQFVPAMDGLHRGKKYDLTYNIMLTSVVKIIQQRRMPVTKKCSEEYGAVNVNNLPPPCPEIENTEEDTRHYLAGWRLYDREMQGTVPKNISTAFMYTSSSLEEWFQDLFGSVTSGYQILLPQDLDEAAKILRRARREGWLDEHTRLLSIEVTLHNPDVSLDAIVRITYDFLGSGTYRTAHVMSFRSDVSREFSIAFFIFNLLFVYDTLRIVMSLYEIGLAKFLNDWAAPFRVFRILFSLLLIFFIGARDASERSLNEHFVEDVLRGDVYRDYTWMDVASNAINFSAGILCVVLTWHFFSIAKHFEVVHILRCMTQAVIPLFTMPLIIVAAYSSFCRIALGRLALEFATLPRSFFVNIQQIISINPTALEDVLMTQPFLYMFYRVTFFSISVLLILNFIFAVEAFIHNDIRVEKRKVRFYKSYGL